MWALLVATGSAFGVVFVAELGDKTQLLALGFGARHSLRTVALGLALGYGVANALAALVGGVLGAALPERPIAIAAGALFLVFAALALRGEHAAGGEGGDDDEPVGSPGKIRGALVPSAAATIALGIAVAEMGDKTQLATAALSARANPIAVWIGATAGAAAAGFIGAVAGRHLGTRVDPRVLRYASAALFAVFGVILLAGA